MCTVMLHQLLFLYHICFAPSLFRMLSCHEWPRARRQARWCLPIGGSLVVGHHWAKQHHACTPHAYAPPSAATLRCLSHPPGAWRCRLRAPAAAAIDGQTMAAAAARCSCICCRSGTVLCAAQVSFLSFPCACPQPVHAGTTRRCHCWAHRAACIWGPNVMSSRVASWQRRLTLTRAQWRRSSQSSAGLGTASGQKGEGEEELCMAGSTLPKRPSRHATVATGLL